MKEWLRSTCSIVKPKNNRKKIQIDIRFFISLSGNEIVTREKYIHGEK